MDRKEAIEIVKKNYPHVSSSGSQFESALRELIPELKESEDERIRKEIIDFLTDGIWNPTIIDSVRQSQRYAKWLSYLEKQKEQKLIDYPYVPGWRKNRDGNKPELKHSVLMLTTHGVAEGEWLGEKWCQYRWSCELKDNEILYWIHLSDLTQLEKEDEIIEKEQHPAEWSEEDKEYLAACIDVINNFYTLSGELKTLPKINVLRREYAEKLKSWLKSLRPQPRWKPSEEQMRCLLDCVSKAKEIYNASVGGYDAYRILVSLYDELYEL